MNGNGGSADTASERGLAAWLPFAPGRVTRYLYKLRREGQGRGRQAAAIGLGIFIGCTPFYGAHFWICLATGWLLRLNRLKLYLAANISNPLCAPVIVFSEIQIGSYIRNGTPYLLSMATVRTLDPWHFAADLLLGSVVVGGTLGAAAALATWAVGQPNFDAGDEDTVAEAAGKYLNAGIVAWEFANGKLRYDPVYRDVLRRVPMPDEGTVLDLGCGRGLMLALLAASLNGRVAGAAARVRLHGIEYRPRMVRLARRALGDRAVVDEADLRSSRLPTCRAALLLDVLHCLTEPQQDALLARLREAVEPGGQLVIREADAGGGWRFRAGEITNRAVAILQGRWRRRFHFRTAQEWVAVLERHGFVTQTGPLGEATPYANVLLCTQRVTGR
jgi:uncharacterized protein (DUF2062 family)